jgi:hypothetical protein
MKWQIKTRDELDIAIFEGWRVVHWNWAGRITPHLLFHNENFTSLTIHVILKCYR